ncbi:MAG: glycosyltransferase family 4 protein, partial [Alteromonadales bacterium]|nr:glycosyltransferase family 4 protein [Alteromonadales bacterium]
MNKNKIWLLLDSSQSGGIESHVLQLAQGLQQYEQQVEVIFLTFYGKHPMREELSTQGINSRSLDGRFNTLCNALKNEQPTVLHTHGYKAGIIGRLAAWINNIPSISTYHAGEIATGKLAFYDWLDRKTAGFAKQRFAVSPQIADRLTGNVGVFNNFINERELKTSTGQQIAFVGRISYEKGPDSFMALAKQFPEIDFHLYGDGPQLAELKSTSSTNLKCHGQQDDMSLVWPNIGLLVMPSRFEGLPMAALEAMARGIPVLAYNVGALHRLIEPEYNGWLVEPENMTELTKRIIQWSHFSQQHKQFLQLACKETIQQQFSSDVAIPKLVANY